MQVRNYSDSFTGNLGQLLVKFFELYGLKFNYEKIGLSIRRGGSYYSKSGKGSDDKRGYGLHVENPQDPKQDIGRGCFKIRDI
jgi:non-canonical poly(A) RNA polymerase PAPD5/7